MPVDFVPLGTKLKPTDDDGTPVENQKNHIVCLCRGEESALVSAISGFTNDQFADKLQKLRLAAHRWGASRMESFFVQGLNAQFPDLRVNCHRIATVNDFIGWIKQGVWSFDKQVVIAFASSGLWGDSNQWAINMEAEFCCMLQIEWSPARSNGKRMLKPPNGKCFANIFVKAKGSLCTKFRNTCKRAFRCAVYCRSEGDDDEDASAPSVRAVTTNAVRKRGGMPKLIAQETASNDSHGFIGNMGYCEGHPYLETLLKKQGKAKIETVVADDTSTITSPLTVSVSSQEKPRTDELQKWLEEQGIRSIDDAKKVLKRSTPAKRSVENVEDVSLTCLPLFPKMLFVSLFLCFARLR